MAITRLVVATAFLSIILGACGAPDKPIEQTFFFDNQADERFIFRLWGEGKELQVTANEITTNFAWLEPLAEAQITIANGVDLNDYTLVLRRGGELLAMQNVTKAALRDREWHLTVDAAGFR